jgi:hypothetical protein
MYLLHETIHPFKDLSENKRKILKIPKETLLVWIRAPAAIYSIACRICELHAKQCRLQYSGENLN